MIKKIFKELSSVLEIYTQNVGCGFFTRKSRKELIKKLKPAIDSWQVDQVVMLLLNFASRMHGKNPDVGYMDQSRLHNLLWANHKIGRPASVYQMLYEFLLLDQEGKNIYNKLILENKIPQEYENVRHNLDKIIGYNWGKKHSLRVVESSAYLEIPNTTLRI